ncbi:hypothetical protein FZW96_10465 [Bacillus sp. BGMRC 2118]|nr:hypothetical protein FZW96_10465 [Bacillus sp. BGMRC 2118]
MNPYHIVASVEGMLVTSWYYGYKKGKQITRKEYFCYGDSFCIGEDCKYIPHIGWFILIKLNNQEELFVSFEAIEKGITTGVIVDLLELHLEMGILRNQIEQTLEDRERERFYIIAPKFNGIHALMEIVGKQREIQFKV